MKQSKLAAMLVTVQMLAGCVPAFAGEGWLASRYASVTQTATAVSITYTNVTRYRQDLACVLATSTAATGTWTLAVSNQGQSNVVVKSVAMTAAAPWFSYEGSGFVPIDANGVVTLSGNLSPGTNVVQYGIHLTEK